MDTDSITSAPPSAPQVARAFQWRALISVLVALGFLMLAVTGMVLFIAPPGRVANWTDWSILGLRKSEWGAVHIWFGLLFLAVSVWHLALNWRTMLNCCPAVISYLYPGP